MRNKRTNTIITLIALSLMLLSSQLWAQKKVQVPVTIKDYTKKTFSPIRKENFDISLVIPEPKAIESVQLEIRSSDNDLIRSLKRLTIKPGEKEYTLAWDGKDMQNQVVPDEAYYPVLKVTTTNKQLITTDFRKNSGGEEVYEFEKNINPGVIEYTLPVASRVLVRAGIKNGPMLRTVMDWEPRVAGYHAERWNGWDQDKVIAVEQNSQVGYLIVGYKLADKAIITYGNNKQSYRSYREAHKWPIKQKQTHAQQLTRNDQVIRPEFYNPVLQQKSPRIGVKLTSTDDKPIQSVTSLEDMLVKVSLNEQDEIYLDQERYEISFFVDFQFIAEEEQGFVPMNWRWSPGRFGIAPGEHILTINVSGYNGQVGVKNLLFNIIPASTEPNTKYQND